MKLEYNNNIDVNYFDKLEEVYTELKDIFTKGNVALSGGSTYLKFLKIVASYLKNTGEAKFFPVDERNVPFSSEFSNWGNTYRDFLSTYNIGNENHFTDPEKYNDYLQDIKMDTIFLGIGDDGHTASLFSCEDVFRYKDRKAVGTISPKKPYERLTFTGHYILEADNIVIIIYGEGKKDILKKIMNNEDIPITTLLREVKNGTIYVENNLMEDENE